MILGTGKKTLAIFELSKLLEAVVLIVENGIKVQGIFSMSNIKFLYAQINPR